MLTPPTPLMLRSDRIIESMRAIGERSNHTGGKGKSDPVARLIPELLRIDHVSPVANTALSHTGAGQTAVQHPLYTPA